MLEFLHLWLHLFHRAKRQECSIFILLNDDSFPLKQWQIVYEISNRERILRIVCRDPVTLQRDERSIKRKVFLWRMYHEFATRQEPINKAQ